MKMQSILITSKIGLSLPGNPVRIYKEKDFYRKAVRLITTAPNKSLHDHIRRQTLNYHQSLEFCIGGALPLPHKGFFTNSGRKKRLTKL